MDDALHTGESDPGPLKLFGAMQALKNTKELVCKTHVEAHSIIADEKYIFVLLCRAEISRRGAEQTRAARSVRREG